MTAARTLTDADVEAIAERLAARLREIGEARPANAPTKPLTISPTTQAAARCFTKVCWPVLGRR